jgi:hypothetical protein
MSFFQKLRRKLITWLRDTSQGKNTDPWSALKAVGYAYGFYYGGWVAILIAFLMVLSFTSWLGGPYVAAQVIFFLIVGTAVLLLVSLYNFWRTLKDKWGNSDTNTYRDARDVKEKDRKDTIDGRIITESNDES